MTQTYASAPKAKRFKTSRSISALVLREMETTYGRSPGGYIWAILEPVGAIALFTLVIAVGLRLRSPSIGSNFMLFYATGFLPFMFFTQTNMKTARAIRFSKQLLRYPSVTYMDALLGRFILNVLTFLIVFYLLMTGIHIGFDLDVYLDIPAILIAIAMAAILGFGLGCFNCFLMTFFPMWENFWVVLTRPLFLLSTVIYAFEDVPWHYQNLVWYNPLIHIIGLMRRGFYPTYDASYVSMTYVFGLGMVFMVFGLLLLSRWHKYLLSER